MARLSETAIAFACLRLCGIETAIAFAGEKWAFVVQFSGAEVMPVSEVPCWRRAVVLLVSISRCFCVLCTNFSRHWVLHRGLVGDGAPSMSAVVGGLRH